MEAGRCETVGTAMANATTVMRSGVASASPAAVVGKDMESTSQFGRLERHGLRGNPSHPCLNQHRVAEKPEAPTLYVFN